MRLLRQACQAHGLLGPPVLRGTHGRACDPPGDSLPYPVVFVDREYIIRYMNRYAQYHYYQERGYQDLMGQSIFACHDKESSRERIRAAFEKMKRDGKEMFVGVNARNQRLYMQPQGRAADWLFRAV